jgi:predicted nucleotidyltransferase
MNRDDVITKLNAQRLGLLQEYGVASLFLFGSVARDEASIGSDVDLLVEFKEPIGLFRFIELQHHLEKLLDCEVDLGTRRSLKFQLEDTVTGEMIRVA